MVDFWMTIGHALANETVLNTILTALPAKEYKLDPVLRVFDFTKSDYDTARTAVRTAVNAAGIKPYPLSMMALGEILYTVSVLGGRQTFQKGIKLMNAAGIDSQREPLFYAALGAAVLDSLVREAFSSGNFEEVMFEGLCQTDKDTLKHLTTAKEFQVLSEEMEIPWVHDCFDRIFFHRGHRHPASPWAIEQYEARYGLAKTASNTY